ncbi:MAG TPA: response regulator transcription factor [Usitatibacter sp.]|nr:response regulator transcription factor [Usitatibacter sp.]
MPKTRILLVDDHVLVRAGIRALLEGIEGATIVAEASHGREALALAREHAPDIVIMDISMKELNGIDATEAMMAEMPDVKVLILSMHAAEEFVRRAMRAGASGYVVKDSVPMELRMAIEALGRGEMYVSPRVSRHLVTALTPAGSSSSDSSLAALTLRQRQVLQMIAEGKSTKEIAVTLELSAKTIETHRAAIMARLGIRDIAGLVMFAARHHLVTLDGQRE